MKWVKAHTGTHIFQNCEYSFECGPCPGICLFAGLPEPTGDGNLPNEKLDSIPGIGYVGFYKLSNTTIGLVFNHNEDFVINRNFYAQEDLDMGTEVANLFNYQKLIIKKGVYALDYSQDPLGVTVVEIITK